MYDHLVDLGVVDVLVHERDECSQKLIGLWLPVYPVDDVSGVEVVFVGKDGPEMFETAFEHFAQQCASEYGSATFVTEDIA